MTKGLIAMALSALITMGVMAENKPTKNQDLDPNRPKTPFLGPEEALKTMKLKDGYYLELVVGEPIIKEPVITVFDGNGNMYVAEMRTYMQDIDGSGKFDPVSRVSMHQDTNGDGKYDKHTIFADKLVLPRIVLPLDNRIIIGETNTLDLYCYEDTDGDGVADKKELWYQGGKRGGNLEHQPSGLIWSLDNWLYTTYNNYRLKFKNGKVIKETIPGNGGQWGLTQDSDGKPWYVNAGGERGPINFQWPITYGGSKAPGEFSGSYKIVWPIDNIPDVQGGLRRVREDNTLNHFTATCGQAIFRGDKLPKEIQGNLFFSEPVGRLIRRTVITKKDGLSYLSNPYEAEKGEFIRTKDPNFRVVNMDTAPDGTLYIADMYRGIIQEGNWVRKGSYLRGVVQKHRLDENFGKGRVWRLRHKDFKLGKQPRMLEETPAQLVKHLSHPNGWWRDTAQKLLILKGDKSVVPALKELVKSGSTTEAKLHALWTLEGLDSADKNIVSVASKDKEPRVRAASARVSEALFKAGDNSIPELVYALAKDSSPDVKIQALLTAKYLKLEDWQAKAEEITKDDTSDASLQIRHALLRAPSKNHSNKKFSKTERKLVDAGKTIYSQLCTSCHGANAKGQKNGPLMMAPPLAGSTRVTGPKGISVNIVMHGLSGLVDGKNYPGGLMVPMGTNGDKWIASVLSYIRTHFGNNASVITEKEVAKVRAATKDRKTPWTLAELSKVYPMPLGNKKAWKLTSSHGANKLMYALDGNLGTRFDTGGQQEPGMWMQIQLPEAKNIHSLVLDAGKSKNDYPLGYRIEMSVDGKSWQKIKESGSRNTLTEINTKPTVAKYIKITLTKKKKGNYWSIHNMDIFAK